MLTSPRLWTIAASACALVALGLFLVSHSYSLYDDAYIYFTYADHVVSGCGLRFRCDELPVEGFTSPAWQALLVAARLATEDLETVSQLYGAASLAVALVAVAVLAHHARLRTAEAEPNASGAHGAAILGAAVVVLLASDGYVLTSAVNGLETPLVLLAVVLVFAAALRDDARGLRLALAFAVLARPECLVFVVAAPLLPAARRLRFWAPLGAFVLAVALARWLVFHDVAPNTYWAKSGGTRQHFTLGLAYLGEFARSFPLCLAAPLALLLPRARAPVAFFLVGAGLWLASFLRTGGDTFFYSRLALPLVPVASLLGAVGLCALFVRVRACFVRSDSRATRHAPTALAVLATLALTWQAARAHSLPAGHGFVNVQLWGELGSYLAREHPGALVAIVPVGIVSYRCHCRVLDLVGLTSRVIAHAGRSVPPERFGRHWIGHERHDLEWTLAQEPDLIVLGTKVAGAPFVDLAATRAGFYAEWLLLQEIKAGRAPYQLYSPEVAPGLYFLTFRRVTGK